MEKNPRIWPGSPPKQKGPSNIKLGPFPFAPQAVSLDGRSRSTRSGAPREAEHLNSDGHDLFFLRLAHLLDPLDLCVRQLLHLIARPLLVIGRDQLVLRSLLNVVIPVTPDIPKSRFVILQ